MVMILYDKQEREREPSLLAYFSELSLIVGTKNEGAILKPSSSSCKSRDIKPAILYAGLCTVIQHVNQSEIK